MWHPPHPPQDTTFNAQPEPFPLPTGPPATVSRDIPYKPDANPLQNLTIYHPHLATRKLNPNFDSTRNAHSIIYIHGGAWRDPLISASSFDPIARYLLSNVNPDSNDKSRIKALASLNYSLSPHPSHPLPSDATPSGRESRTAMHPQHAIDIHTALAFLQENHQMFDRYILVGHSCGATLALQVLYSRLVKDELNLPEAVIAVDGLYDLPRLTHNPGPGYDELRGVYREILAGAFGENEERWEVGSPVTLVCNGSLWREPGPMRPLIAVDSREDELVHNEGQIGALMGAFGLDATGGGSRGLNVVRRSIEGRHDEAWGDGRDVAGIVEDVLGQVN